MKRILSNRTETFGNLVAYIKLLRIKHYIKNILIFFPLFFGRSIFDPALLLRTVEAFAAFSFSSSCIYILNDIKDAEKDSKHPKKCTRPIASGRISKWKAGLTAIFMVVLTVGIIAIGHISGYATGCLGVYIAINILYSCGLKNVALMDIVILTSGYILRILYGALISGIAISNWMYLTILMASLYAAFGKRRNELALNIDSDTRAVLKKYNYAFLDKCMYMALTSAIIFYSLWAISEFPGSMMIFTIPLVIIICLLYSLIVEGASDGDPVEVILNNPAIILISLCWGVLTMACLYF